MKIIEAMKDAKAQDRKVDDLKKKIRKYCADLDVEDPVYEKQEQKVKEWIQSACDSVKEGMRLRIAIQKTNLATEVTIRLGDKEVTKTIAEWILRRRMYADQECSIWNSLNADHLTSGKMKTSTGDVIDVKRRLYFNPEEKDKKVEIYSEEPQTIDRTLEVVNATTDLIE